MKFLIFCGVVATILIMCAGCETPAPPYPYEEVEAKFGSHDFFLEGEDKVTSSKLATKCLTCGIYFTHPSYGEHIKTCCP